MRRVELSLLSLYAALAVAHSGSDHVHPNEAAESTLDALPPKTQVPDLDSKQYGVVDQETLLGQQVVDSNNFQGTNGTPQHKLDSSHSHAWTQSKPCYKSAKTELTYCVFTDNNFAEGRGTSIVTTAERAAHLVTYPAFTVPESIQGMNQDLVRTIPAVYDMQEFPGKGMGLVASKDIKRGDLIMANTPSVMIDYRVFEELPDDEWMELQALAVDHLPEAHREAVMRLSTHDGGELNHVQKVNKITTTNAFDIDPRADDKEQDNGFFVVFPEIARMNHDCRPNADYYFDHNTLSQYIHAIRPIRKGEEITLSYINPRMKHEARQRKLQRIWGFACVCDMCTRKKARIEASDSRVQLIKELAHDLGNHDADSRATPQMAELFISLHETEEIWGMMYEAYTYAAQEYNGVGDPWTAIKYAQLAVEWGTTAVGPLESNVADMRKLAEDPWSHWSWMARTKKRNGWGKRKSAEAED